MNLSLICTKTFSRQIVQFLFYGFLKLHGEWRIDYNSIFCFECKDETMYSRQESFGCNIIQLYTTVGKKTSAERKCRQRIIILPVLYFTYMYYLCSRVMQFQTVSILSEIPGQL